jgi:serine/threonine-protein kinase
VAAQGLVGHVVEGRYRLERIIGEGGMGAVFAAQDLLSSQHVAVKVLHPTAYDEDNLRRFRLEGRATRTLDHPSVCRVFGHGALLNGSPYIVMELLKGETLRSRLRGTGPLPVGDAISIAMQLLDGLAAAHARGVIHRDVKPGNVFITSSPGEAPRIKLIDFGLAKVLARAPKHIREEVSVITKTGVIPGTPQYLSPEQLGGVRDLDDRADVWSAGLVLYEMLSGHKAFYGENYHMIAAAITLREPESLRAVRNDVPPELEQIVARALAKNREQRFADVHAFRSALLDCWARVRFAGIQRGSLLVKGELQAGRPVARPRQPSELETDLNLPIFVETTDSWPTKRMIIRR